MLVIREIYFHEIKNFDKSAKFIGHKIFALYGNYISIMQTISTLYIIKLTCCPPVLIKIISPIGHLKSEQSQYKNIMWGTDLS